MKHLLIILSFLLLSSPVIGDNHKGETLYLWRTSSGEVWKGFGDKETHSVYKGDVKDGKPNGVGIMIYWFGGKYVGEWKNGEWNGQGTYTWIWGDKYVGKWKDGKEHGQGTKTNILGGKYVGEWKNGLEWNGTGYVNGNVTRKVVNGEYFLNNPPLKQTPPKNTTKSKITTI